MGLLFVRAGDEQAAGLRFDLQSAPHGRILAAARANPELQFPLVRRLNKFYQDVLFDADEVPHLLEELRRLRLHCDEPKLDDLMSFCRAAVHANEGVETIAD